MTTKNDLELAKYQELQELLEDFSVEELRKILEEKEQQAMKKLAGQRIFGFLLSIKMARIEMKGKKYCYPVIYADKSISGKRCLLRLGKVFTAAEVEKAIIKRMKEKIKKDIKQKIFLPDLCS